MSGFYVFQRIVTCEFAAGIPAYLESHGFVADVEYDSLEGRLKTPVPSGVIMWKNGGLWMTVGLPVPEGSVDYFTSSSRHEQDKVIIVLECQMPSRLRLFRFLYKQSDANCFYCFEFIRDYILKEKGKSTSEDEFCELDIG